MHVCGHRCIMSSHQGCYSKVDARKAQRDDTSTIQASQSRSGHLASRLRYACWSPTDVMMSRMRSEHDVTQSLLYNCPAGLGDEAHIMCTNLLKLPWTQNEKRLTFPEDARHSRVCYLEYSTIIADSLTSTAKPFFFFLTSSALI